MTILIPPFLEKKTYTGLLLNFNAICPIQWKTTLIDCLLSRAHSISSDEALFKREINFLRNLFVENGYPSRFFENVKNKFMTKISKSIDRSDHKDTEKKFMFKIPYIGTPSLVFKRKLKKIFRRSNINIVIVFTSTKVGRYFSLKDLSDKLLRSSVVYKFHCSGDPNISYIGKTKRYLQKRITEHQTSASAIRDHLQYCQKCSDSKIFNQSFGVVGKCNTDFELQILEAIEIISRRPSLNKQLANDGSSYVLNIF